MTGLLNKNPIEEMISVRAIYTIYNHSLEPSYAFPGERHDFWELNYLLEGHMGMTNDDSVFELQKNQACLIRPNVFHTNWTLDGMRANMVVVCFQLEPANALLASDMVVQFDDSTASLMRKLAQEGTDWLQLQDGCLFFPRPQFQSGAPQIVKNLLELLLIEMLRNSGHVQAPVLNENTRMFRKAVAYLREHIRENLEMQDIAQALLISPSTLKNIFKKYTGGGVMTYFTDLKIAHAKSLLVSGMPICEISDALSFSSQNYFSMVFKRVTGCSPAKYRAAAQRQPK